MLADWYEATGAKLRRLEAPRGFVGRASLSPCGTTLLIATLSGDVHVFHVETASPRITLEGHRGAVVSAAYGRDGKAILTASQDGTVRLWHGETGEVMATWSLPEPPTGAAFAPGGDTILAASRDGILRCWPMDGGSASQVFAGFVFRLPRAPMAPDGSLTAILSTDAVALVDTRTGDVVRRLHDGSGASVRTAAFSPDGRTLITGSQDGRARLWPVSQDTPPTVLCGHRAAVLDADMSPDGTMVATAGGSDGTARLWRTCDGALLGVLPGKARDTQSVAFSPDGRHLAIASWDGIARLFDVTTHAVLGVLEKCWLDAIHPAFSPDGQRIVTAAFGAAVRVWDVLSGDEVMALPEADGQRVFFSPCGGMILVVKQDGVLKAFDARTAEDLNTLEGQEAPVTWAAFSADSRSIVSASVDGIVRVWSTSTGEARVIAKLARRGSHKVALSPDGAALLAAPTQGGDLLCLSCEDGRELWRQKADQHAIGPCPFAREAGRLISLTGSAEGRTATILSWPSGRCERTVGQEAMVRSAAFSPDARHTVTGSIHGTAEVIDAANGTTRVRLTGHKAAVLDAALFDYGRLAVTASFDRTARLWSVATGKALAEARFDFAPTSLAIAGGTIVFSDTIGQLFLAEVPVKDGFAL